MVQSERQTAHKSFFLLKVELCENAVVFLCDRGSLEHEVIEFCFGVRYIQYKKSQHKHTLVAALQILQELFRFVSVCGKIGRKNFHIVSAADCFFLLLNHTFVEVCYLALDGLDSRNLIDGAHVHGNDK